MEGTSVAERSTRERRRKMDSAYAARMELLNLDRSGLSGAPTRLYPAFLRCDLANLAVDGVFGRRQHPLECFRGLLIDNDDWLINEPDDLVSGASKQHLFDCAESS